MGIYDRDYYRGGGSNFLGSLATNGRITNALIGINLLAFLCQMMTKGNDPNGGATQSFTDALSLNVPRVLDGEVWRLLTFAFLHDTGSIMHILMNMLMLFWFGRQVEERLGGKEYLWVYLLSAVLSGVAFVGASLLDLHKGSAIGASGAVTAVLVLAACYNPRQVIYLFLILPVPIWGFIIFSVAIDFFGLVRESKNGIATSAHLGGAAFAFCYYKLHWRIGGWLHWLPTWKRGKSEPSLKLYSEEDEHEPLHARVSAPRPPVPPRPSASRPEDAQLEAQADVILEKIARVGMQGLTDSERALLVRASEMMKRRRS